MPHHLSTMATILRLMIVLYTWVLYFHAMVVFLKIARDCMIKPERHMYSVLRKSRVLCLPVDIQLQLFDSMVAPILLYGSEAPGFEKSDILESLYLQFYKIILKAKNSTPNVILYGELGKYPIYLIVKSRMIGFGKGLIKI